MRLAWTPEALEDRRAIYDYIEGENPAAAIALDERISEAASRLLAHPGLGPPGRITGTRELTIHSNYIVVYDLANELVRILRVLHAAREWPST